MQDDLCVQSDIIAENMPYQVLARKYRPSFLSELVGQDVLVQTISNSFKLNRLPHATILTGTRGVGKTTTARIIAKILNCLQLSIEKNDLRSCERCESCLSIGKSQNTDVLEIDAASHTGVNDIRTIIENVHYLPVISRYKVYIIDEVHMLSNSAFNALLKTLEEPPSHTIFLFATTEIQKVPLTILSRCQRFDLKRVNIDHLKVHYEQILKKEGISIEEGAIELVAKAADGSVRDGLSILDQAISLSNGHITVQSVEQMFCITNKSQIIQLFFHILDGNILAALALNCQLYDSGADPAMIINQLLEVVHEISVSSITGKVNSMRGFLSEQLVKLKDVSISFLSISWQVLLNGLEDLKKSSMQLQALEMLLIKLCYMNTSITPNDLLNNYKKQSQDMGGTIVSNQGFVAVNDLNAIDNLDHLILSLYENNELSLYYIMYNEVGVISMRRGYICLNPLNADKCFIRDLKAFLEKITMLSWNIELVDSVVQTLAEKMIKKDEIRKEEASEHEIVKEVLRNFTGSRIIDIKVD